MKKLLFTIGFLILMSADVLLISLAAHCPIYSINNVWAQWILPCFLGITNGLALYELGSWIDIFNGRKL